MSKKIICVFQDCAMCGDKGKALKKFVIDKKIDFKLVSFASEEGKELIYQAVTEHDIKTMPFFTDGTNFASNIKELGKKETPVLTKKSKSVKTGKKKKGAKE